MPFLACVHHVQWLTAVPGGKFQCSYCRAFVQKKDIYPKWDDLGPDFQEWWAKHEATAPPPSTPAPSPLNPPGASQASPGSAAGATESARILTGTGPDTPAQPEQKPASDTENAPHAPRKPQ